MVGIFWIKRTGELFALRWKDIHIDTGRIDVNGAITKLDDGSYGRDSTKSKRNRITYIFNKDAIDILKEPGMIHKQLNLENLVKNTMKNLCFYKIK